jgi:4-hydroxy-tetrahydrodipicolinate reductase
MNIALIGYGKMGHEVEKIILDRGHSLTKIIDINNRNELKDLKKSGTDVAIEFTTPETVVENIYSCFEIGLPIVTGTTGWHDKLQEVSRVCGEKDSSLFYASNFSIGVNIFFAVNKNLAGIMERFEEYDVSLEETHHTQKLDAPSGTAVTLADIIEEELTRKKGWSLDASDRDMISVRAYREGDVKGNHKVKYESEIDFIQLEHNAKNRKGFALGAVLAAEFLQMKKGVYTMQDLLGI